MCIRDRIEAYVDEDENVTLIKINTYLAQVANVDKGTVKVDFIYGTDFANIDKEFDTAVEYEEDDYVLVTVANGEIQSMVMAESKTGKVTAYADGYVKMGDEELNKTQVLKDNDTTANDDFYAIDYDSEMKVILDQYGYVIGIVVEEEADTAYSYVLVTDSEGRANSLLNGKAAVVEVMHLDGKTEVLSLETKKENDQTKFKLNGSWVAITENNSPLPGVGGWYRYTMTKDGEIVLKNLKDEKAVGGTNVTFTANGKQKLQSLSGLGNHNADSFILNSKTVLHVVDEDSNKTYTGYKNIDKAVDNGNVLFVRDGKLLSDIYVLDTEIASDDIYAYYNGTYYENDKGTWVTMYVDGEAQNYIFDDETYHYGRESMKVKDLAKGVYVIKTSDNDLTELNLIKAMTTRAKVVSAQDSFFKLDGETDKHYYAEDVKVFDITDDGKAGTIARNDYVVYVEENGFVTYAYIVSAPDTTKPDENVNDGKYNITVANGTATIVAPKGTEKVTVTALKYQDGIYAEADNQEIMLHDGADNATGTYNPAASGQYSLKLTVGKTVVGTYGPFSLLQVQP